MLRYASLRFATLRFASLCSASRYYIKEWTCLMYNCAKFSSKSSNLSRKSKKHRFWRFIGFSAARRCVWRFYNCPWYSLCPFLSKWSSKSSQYHIGSPKNPVFWRFIGFLAARRCVWNFLYCPCHSLGPYLPRKKRIFQIGWELFFIWIHEHTYTHTNIQTYKVRPTQILL